MKPLKSSASYPTNPRDLWFNRQSEILDAWLQQESLEGARVEFSDPVEWIESNFWIPERRGPLELMPYHKAVLREAYRLNENGRFVYDTVVWSDIKKSAKSSIAAAVALHRAMSIWWGTIKIIANDEKQADSRVTDYLRRALILSPFFEENKDYRFRRSEVSLIENYTKIEALPIDPTGEAGGNDDFLVFSELWGFTTPKHSQMWTEMTLSPLKYGRSQRWVETYAGYSGESLVLEGLYTQATTNGRKLDLSFTDEQGYHDLQDLDVWAVGGLLLMWNTVPRCPWQIPEYYASEATNLTTSEYSRIHENRWIKSTQKFIDDQWWEDCYTAVYPKFAEKEKMVLALDAAVSGDSFGLVGTSEKDGRTWVRYSKEWTPPDTGKIDFQGTAAEPGPEREVIRLWLAGMVSEVRYDPYQLHDMATRLSNGFIMMNGSPFFPDVSEIRNGRWRGHKLDRIKMVEFSQASQRLRSDKQLYDRIKETRIAHQGGEALTSHVQNANRKEEGGTKLRIVKRTPDKKIDLCVALSMAGYNEADDSPPKLKAGVR